MTYTYKNSDQNILYTSTVEGAGGYEVIPLELAYTAFTVQVTPTGGSVSVYASNDNVNFALWDEGSVTATTIDTCAAVRYLKIENGTATSTSVSIWGYK